MLMKYKLYPHDLVIIFRNQVGFRLHYIFIWLPVSESAGTNAPIHAAHNYNLFWTHGSVPKNIHQFTALLVSPESWNRRTTAPLDHRNLGNSHAHFNRMSGYLTDSRVLSSRLQGMLSFTPSHGHGVTCFSRLSTVFIFAEVLWANKKKKLQRQYGVLQVVEDDTSWVIRDFFLKINEDGSHQVTLVVRKTGYARKPGVEHGRVNRTNAPYCLHSSNLCLSPHLSPHF